MRIVTAREQVELLAPWRTAMPWYHHSPHELPSGTLLTPRGGKSPWSDHYDSLDPEESHQIQNRVWVDSDLETNRQRGHGSDGYIYQVEPTTHPQESPIKGAGGYVTDSAHILDQVGRTSKPDDSEYQDYLREIGEA